MFWNACFYSARNNRKEDEWRYKGNNKKYCNSKPGLLVHDQTILGSCSDGFLFTDDILYYYGGMFTTRIAIKYNEISDVIYEKTSQRQEWKEKSK